MEELSEPELRERVASVPGLCVLDVSEENILSFAQGDWQLVERDLQAAFAEDVAEAIAAAVQEEVKTCLAVRRELINYKKLCLHMWQAASLLEKDLRQLSSFFYCELVGDAPEEQKRCYVEAANGLSLCRGACAALFDARHFSKAICALPRHPKSGAPWKFEELPQSLEIWKPLEEAEFFLGNHRQMDAYFAASHATGPTGPTGAPGPTARPRPQPRPWRSERGLVASALGSADLAALVKRLAPLALAPLARRYVEAVLVARGAVKALAIRRALGRYMEALEAVESRAALLEGRLGCLPLQGSAVSAGLHLHRSRHLLVLQGMRPVLKEMLTWLQPILHCTASAPRIFVSGAKGACAFVPHGFPDLLAVHRAKVQEHRPRMLAELAPGGSGWPRSARPEKAELQACQRCAVRLSRLWLHRGLCLLCENRLRDEGRCPFSDRCRSFCPHDRRCFVCEQWSCSRCGLLRGEGEDVAALAAATLFVDFDRTLCTTKAGASPLQGQHSLDPELLGLCRTRRVLIVTRSSRSEDIALFLRQHGVDASVEQPEKSGVWVRSVKREGKSKAQVILEELQLLGSGAFVDDDITELIDPALEPLVAEGRLLRVLFVRSGGKE